MGVEIKSEFISDGSNGFQDKGRKIVKDVACKWSLLQGVRIPSCGDNKPHVGVVAYGI